MYIYVYNSKFLFLLNHKNICISIGEGKANFLKKFKNCLILKSFYLL